MNRALFIERSRNRVRRLAGHPQFGRYVRMLVAIWRGPETRDLAVNAWSWIHSSDNKPAREIQNLATSVPVSLRELRFTQRQLDERQQSIEATQRELDKRLESEADEIESLKRRFSDATDAANSLIERLETIEKADFAGISSQNGRRISELEGAFKESQERFEFVRNELMYEMHFGARTTDVVEPAKIKAKEKIEAFGNELKLNLGCGHIIRPDYINIDKRDLPGIDVVSDLSSLPFSEGSVAEIYSAHLLEHFSKEELKRRVLPRLVRLLRPSGRFVAVTPDAKAMISAYASDKMSFEDLRYVTFGAQEYDGDYHFNMFSIEQAEEILVDAGLSDFKCIERGRRNGLCLEMEFEAFKRV